MESVLSPAMNDEKVLNTATDSAANTAVTAAVGTARISNDELISNVSIIGVPICTFSSFSIATLLIGTSQIGTLLHVLSLIAIL